MIRDESVAHDCDVLVIGSGAAGLTAAVTAAHFGLSVVVIEKASVLGGTSAWSGGWLWVPRNHLARAAGIDEEADESLRYLASELGNRANDPRLSVFIETAPEMAEFLQEHTAMEWIDGNHIPDFHETPGHAAGGRSLAARPYDARALGAWVNVLRPPLDVISLRGMGIGSGEDMAHLFNATRAPRSALYALRRIARHALDMARHGRGMQLFNGNALVARLLRSALDKGVRVYVNTPALALYCRYGRVAGAEVQAGPNRQVITARVGVVLAGGGFPHDRARIAEMFEHAPRGDEHHSAAPPENTGDTLRMAEALGAEVVRDLASPGAWAPVSLVPKADGTVARFPHLIERAKPGIIAVDASGRRFVNEADSYHDFMSALFRANPGQTAPRAWLIADHRAQRRYGLGWAKPFPLPLRPALRSGYLKRGDTLAALAANCNLPASALINEVESFNRHARQGQDPQFGRGASRYNRVQGDATHQPNPALGALETPPFYAVEIVPGSLGTFGGLRTDIAARVLDRDGAPIEGLFAVGNDMASIMGGHYPSGGITLGPGMTFGYRVGRFMAGCAGCRTSTTTSDESQEATHAMTATGSVTSDTRKDQDAIL